MTHAAACVSISGKGEGGDAGDDGKSQSDGRPEPPCFEMLLSCKSIEMTHTAAVCMSTIEKGDDRDGDEDAQERERRQARVLLL